VEEYYFNINIGNTKDSKLRSQNSPMVLMVSQSCLLIHLFLKKMYQLLILNWPTTKFILFTTKIIIFRIYFKRKYASTNKKTVFMYCCMTFVTKNKYLLIYVISFLLLCFFRSFFLSYFTRFNFAFIIAVTSDNTTALIEPEPRIGSPRSMLQFTRHFCIAKHSLFPNIQMFT
jgi:hypothetical protein